MACLQTKQLCDAMGFKYEYRNIDEDTDARTEFMECFPGILAVPIIEWNGEVFQGYNKFCEAVENNIQNHGEGTI